MLKTIRKPILAQGACFKASTMRQGAKHLPVPSKSHPFGALCRFFSSHQTQNRTNSDSSTTSSSSRYRDAFNDLQAKININQSQEKLKKMAAENTFADLKQKVQEKIHIHSKAQPNTHSEQAAQNKSQTQEDQTAQQQAVKDGQVLKAEKAESNIENKSQQKTEATTANVSWRERILPRNSILGKIVDYVEESWKMAFPSEEEHFHKKTEKVRQLAKKAKQQETVNLTEEELAEIQLNIPEWKRHAIAQYTEEVEEPGITRRLSNHLANKFRQTEFAKNLYASEEYKSYQEFRTEMRQFKEDLKDHLHSSQNPAVIASLAVYGKVTSDSSTAKAIKEMKKYDKDFDIFELEQDAKFIFNDVYNAFLKGDIEFLEKVCGEMALAYFKTLIKKREVDGVYPKYQELWYCDKALLIGGQVPDRRLPCFTFTISTQEIHCSISKKNNKVVDGAEDRIMQNQYNFVLTLHEDPDLEVVGHRWQVIELQQVGNLIALV